MVKKLHLHELKGTCKLNRSKDFGPV